MGAFSIAEDSQNFLYGEGKEKGYKGGMEERARKKGNAVTVQCTMAVHRRSSSSRCSIG